MKPEAIRSFVTDLALAAGELIRPLYLQPGLAVERKADESPVTAADRGAEQVMRRMINSRFPAHGIMAEEFGNENENAEWVWVLDPIDGTLSFTSGCPLFGTLIGLLHHGEPVAGCIYQPILNQLCLGDGRSTTLNDRPVRVREVEELSEALVLTTDITNIEKQHKLSGFEALRRQSRLCRTWGDCYGYLLLASGLADVMLDPIMNPWDILPLIAVVRGAGGVITAWDGSDPVKASSCVAAGPKLHARVLELLHAS